MEYVVIMQVAEQYNCEGDCKIKTIVKQCDGNTTINDIDKWALGKPQIGDIKLIKI